MLGVTEVRVGVVCPEGNRAYRDTITSHALRAQLPKESTLEQGARALWRDPVGFAMTSQHILLEAVRVSLPDTLAPWDAYIRERYGW
jgi:hypothetical protein